MLEFAPVQDNERRSAADSKKTFPFRRHTMKISARNCIEGKIIAIKEGPVSCEVTIETAAGEQIVSSITTTSAQNLGLKVGGKAYAVIKASNVMVAVD